MRAPSSRTASRGSRRWCGSELPTRLVSERPTTRACRSSPSRTSRHCRTFFPGFPVEKIADALAARLGENGTALAARLPVLRPAVCRHLISQFSKKNALVAAAIFIPGVDMPVLTLNQIRLVLRIALAYGEEIDRQRAAELVGVVGAAFGFRAAARELLDLVPVAGWAVKGAVAYTGTKALGEAAVRYFEARR